MSSRIPIGSPVRTQAIINRYFLHAKKNLGQNFLVNQDVIQGINRAAGIKEGDQVIEIGPGIGSLTESLLLNGAKVFAYEVDPKLPPILRNELPVKIKGQKLDKRFKLLLKDVLKADFKQDLAGFFDLQKAVKVVANLPYYITTPIIFFLANSSLPFKNLTLMMQREVAQRLEAKPNSKAYSPLTIAVQTEMQVKEALAVSRNSFWPRPQVDSSVLVLTPLKNRLAKAGQQHFNWVVRMCFAQRRKTINNNLKSLLPDKKERLTLFKHLGIAPNLRPENLTISQFQQLAAAIPSKKPA